MLTGTAGALTVCVVAMGVLMGDELLLRFAAEKSVGSKSCKITLDTVSYDICSNTTLGR